MRLKNVKTRINGPKNPFYKRHIIDNSRNSIEDNWRLLAAVLLKRGNCIYWRRRTEESYRFQQGLLLEANMNPLFIINSIAYLLS
jgi:hypothetical protein